MLIGRKLIKDSDLLVKVVDVKETSRVTHLMDYNKSARSAVWDPTGKYLVSCHLGDDRDLLN